MNSVGLLHGCSRTSHAERVSRSLRIHSARSTLPGRHARARRCPLTVLARRLATLRRGTAAPVAS